MTEQTVPFSTSDPTGDPGASRVTAPASGVYDLKMPFTAQPGGTVELQWTQTAPRLLFDPEALRAQVGQRIVVNGPRQITGVLVSADVADDGLSVKLRIETEHA